MLAESEIENAKLPLVVLGADEVVAWKTTTKNPHPIEIAGEKLQEENAEL